MTLIETIKEKYKQLEAINQSLLSDISQLSEEDLLRRPDDKSWCIIQVLDHVKNTELGTLLYIRKKLKYGGLKNLSWSAGLRNFLMKSVNNSSVRFKMPSVLLQPEASKTLDQIITEWSELRTKWHGLFDEFPKEHLDKAIFKHPFFGRLSLSQAIDSMTTHQNHHIKQINRIKKAYKLDKRS